MLIITTHNETYRFHIGRPAAAIQLAYILEPAQAMTPGKSHKNAGKASKYSSPNTGAISHQRASANPILANAVIVETIKNPLFVNAVRASGVLCIADKRGSITVLKACESIHSFSDI